MKKIDFLIFATIAFIFFFIGCQKEHYMVTFHPNGAQGVAVSQPFTQKISQPLMANPFTNLGHVFTGWNTSPEGAGISYKEQENVIMSSNMVLYAQWGLEGDTFTVTFHANGGGTGNMEEQEFDIGVPQPLFPNAFIYDGYRFSCWCTDPNGNGLKFENQQNITVSSNMMLYAQWIPVTVTYFVHFNPNGGEGSIQSQLFIGGVLQALDSNTFRMNEHFFTGWNTKTDGKGTPYKDNEEIIIFRNLLLYAQWEEDEGEE
jgi:hypothetical protein